MGINTQYLTHHIRGHLKSITQYSLNEYKHISHAIYTTNWFLIV